MGEVWRVLSLRENNRLCTAAAAAVQTDCQSWCLYRLHLPVKSVCELSVQIASADTQSVFVSVSAVQSASARALACDRHPVCVTDMATQFAWLAMQFEQQLWQCHHYILIWGLILFFSGLQIKWHFIFPDVQILFVQIQIQTWPILYTCLRYISFIFIYILNCGSQCERGFMQIIDFESMWH